MDCSRRIELSAKQLHLCEPTGTCLCPTVFLCPAKHKLEKKKEEAFAHLLAKGTRPSFIRAMAL